MASALVAQGDSLKEKRMRTNLILQDLCQEEDVLFIDHAEIRANKHLNGSKLHCNRSGDSILARGIVFTSQK